MLTATLEGVLVWRDDLRYSGEEQLLALVLELDTVQVPVLALGLNAETWEDIALGTLVACDAEFVFEKLEDGLSITGQWQTNQGPRVIF